MLSQNKKVINSPTVDNRFVVRLKFVKKGNLQYISHLDLQRTFNRVLKRSGVPVWYTQGFNPHMKLVFSLPLSIGTESECEYLDIQMEGNISCEEILERINREVTDELRILEVYFPKRKFADIMWSDYRYEIFCEGASEELAQKINTLFSTSPLNMVKSTKSGEKEIDIVPFIKKLEAVYDEEKKAILINARLSSSSAQFLNPEMLVGAMREKLGILSGNPTSEIYTITRINLLDEKEEIFK